MFSEAGRLCLPPGTAPVPMGYTSGRTGENPACAAVMSATEIFFRNHALSNHGLSHSACQSPSSPTDIGPQNNHIPILAFRHHVGRWK